MKRISVFCGSSPGKGKKFITAAAKMGKAIVNNKFELIYGGAKVGTMGVIADTVLENGGYVSGIMPKNLVDREVAHPGLTKFYEVSSMHERKALIEEMSDAFIAMPGGLGTTEELFEMWTWGQLGLHQKPIALYNVNGFFDKLLEYVDELVENEFLEKGFRDMLIISDNAEEILEKLTNYTHPHLDKAVEALKKLNN